MEQSNLKQQHHHHILINSQYVVKQYKCKVGKYNCYEGFHTKTKEKVIVYIKLTKIADSKQKQSKLNKNIYYKLQTLLPKLLWSGQERINNILYHINVFQKLGPSLKQILKIRDYNIPSTTIHIILFNILRLIEKITQNFFVYKKLKFSKILLAKKIDQNELYFSDIIEIQKKGQICQQSNSKYSSIGSHLGLKSSHKDDIQTFSYMIFDLFTNGLFLKRPANITIQKKREYYLNLKSNLKFTTLKAVPEQYINFYLYCRNLPMDQTPNFQYWKKSFKRYFHVQMLKLPYCWQQVSKVKQQVEQEAEQLQQSVQIENQFDDETISQKLKKINIVCEIRKSTLLT